MNLKFAQLSVIALLACATPAMASFHLMQVEQVVAGLDGDATAQAIQLRMRAADQDLVSMTRIRAWNASGKNPVMILDITSNVTSGAAGSRILLATSGFTTKVKALNAGFAPDFTLAHPIPQSYLAAGRLTFERDTGEILWSIAWGGSSYTGANLGTRDNDADGNFGPAFANALPTASRQGVRFKGLASAKSTTNAAEYALSPDPATVVRNDGVAFAIGPVPEIVVVQPLGSNLVDGSATRSFGSVSIGGKGKTKTFTIFNAGSAALKGLKITKSGSHADDFNVTAPVKSSIVGGTKTTFKVTFKPLAKGTSKAAIHIASNDADENPFDIKLSGAGVE